MKPPFSRRVVVAPALIALGLAACGSDTSDSTNEASAGTATSTDEPISTDAPLVTDDMDGMDHSAMNMGDPDATPADEVKGASLARGEYVLMDSRPAGYDDVAGTAVIARSPAGTTITTELTGLLANVDYISHAHSQACNDDNAGDHYQFEVGGSKFPPNEIHLAFTSDADGNGFMTAENDQIAGVDAVAFVVHPVEFIDNKIACVDFVEDEPGSLEAAIAAGLSDSSHDMDHSNDMDHGDDMDDMDDMDHGDDEDDAGHADNDGVDDDAENGSGHDSDGDHGGHDEAGEIVGDLGALDVPALHDVDEELAAGTIDAATQLPVVQASLAALEAVGPNVGNAKLVAALTDLQAALEAGDLATAAPAAKLSHDIAHSMQDHEA